MGVRSTRPTGIGKGLVRNLIFADVENDQHRLGGQEGETAKDLLFLFVKGLRSEWPLVLEDSLTVPEHFRLALEFRHLPSSEIAADSLEPFLYHQLVLEDELLLDV